MSSCQIADIKSKDFYEYHHATKHTVEKLYSYGHRLDWASQPDPFLRFDGAPVVDLPHQFYVSQDDFFQTVSNMVTSFQVGSKTGVEPFRGSDELLSFLSNLLFFGTAISAWKQVVGTDHRWALRVNASSGNLHPTDTNVLVRENSEGLKAGLYHYRVDEHKLEQRHSGDLVSALMDYLQLDCAAPPLVLCMTSIFFREVWKYRERGFRYCQHDMGHALAALSLSAAALGWDSRIVGLFPDDQISEFLGLNRSSEKPLALMLLSSVNDGFPKHESQNSFLKPVQSLQGASLTRKDAAVFAGQANRLTTKLIEYPSVEKVYAATKYGADDFIDARKRLAERVPRDAAMPGPLVPSADLIDIGFDGSRTKQICLHKSVHQTIRGRRSAVDMDGETAMPKEHVQVIVRSATLGFAADFQGVDQVSQEGRWKAASHEHLIHLYLYVHRVDGLEPGLYFFNRFESSLIPLLLADQKEMAMSTSCFQDIAGDGAFSVSMIADFATGYELYGDRCYRLAHYEAGYIGQLLYLAAYALGHDATGIGCFIDDAINNYLALDEGQEVIYNFTFGKSVLDPRLTTLPSYKFGYPEF